MPDVPKKNVDTTSPHISIGAAAGPPMISTATYDLDLSLPADFPTSGHIMSNFHENLVGISPIYDAKYSVLFKNKDVHIINSSVTPVITGW